MGKYPRDRNMAEQELSLDNELISDEELSGMATGEVEQPSGEEVAPEETPSEETPQQEVQEVQAAPDEGKDPMAKFRNPDGSLNEDLVRKSYTELEATNSRKGNELHNIRKALLTQGTTLAGRQVDPNASSNQQTTYQQPPGQVNGQQQIPSFNQQPQAEDLSNFLSDDMMLGESDLRAFDKLMDHKFNSRGAAKATSGTASTGKGQSCNQADSRSCISRHGY